MYIVCRQNLNVNVVILPLLVLDVVLFFVGQDASRTTTGLVNEESSQEASRGVFQRPCRAGR